MAAKWLNKNWLFGPNSLFQKAIVPIGATAAIIGTAGAATPAVAGGAAAAGAGGAAAGGGFLAGLGKILPALGGLFGGGNRNQAPPPPQQQPVFLPVSNQEMPTRGGNTMIYIIGAGVVGLLIYLFTRKKRR